MRRERRMFRAVSFRGHRYWIGNAAWIVYFVWPLLPGWLVGRLFQQLQRDDAGGRFWALLAALLAAETTAVVFIRWGHTRYMEGMYAAVSATRVNALAGQLASGGREAAPRQVPAGDALARLRDERQAHYCQAPIHVHSGNGPHTDTLRKILEGIDSWL